MEQQYERRSSRMASVWRQKQSKIEKGLSNWTNDHLWTQLRVSDVDVTDLVVSPPLPPLLSTSHTLFSAPVILATYTVIASSANISCLAGSTRAREKVPETISF